MPFPWKKTRATRISQIVADLQSPKRGGSLVVETGFPTSLVDLFVKHRDRLKNRSARKKLRKKRSKHEIYDPITLRSSPLSPRSIVDPGGSAVDCTGSDRLEIENLEILEGEEVVGDHGCELLPSPTEVGDVGGRAAVGNNVCVVALKVFVVAVLALSTKKIVVGITLSAFTLVLLEFVGVRFLKPCSNSKAVLKSLVGCVSRRLWIRKDVTAVQNLGNCERESVPAASLSREYASIGFPELSASIDEIELVEPNVDAGADERPEGTEDDTHRFDPFRDKKRSDGLDCEKKTRFVEEKNDVAELRVCQNQRGTRRKLNGRIFKKLVSRKLGSPSIEKNEGKELKLISERSNHLGDNEILVEEQFDEEEDDENQEQDLEPRNIFCEEEEDNNRKIPGYDAHCPAVEISETSEIPGIEREGSLGYLILVLIVLAGLFGGRILAVMFTIGGCFIFKLIEISRRRSLNLPWTG